MRISLIMSVLNGEGFLDRALSSIYAQSHKVDEIIIVDDGSTDKTPLILKSWLDRLPIQLISNKSNKGISSSLNSAAERCTSTWFLRLDADDFWGEGHVQGLLNLISRDDAQNLVLVSSQTQLINSKSISTATELIDDRSSRVHLMWDNIFTHSAVAINLNAFNLAGRYKTNERWEDYDLWVRLLAIGKVAIGDKYSCFYNVSDNSISRILYSDAIFSRWDIQKKAIVKFFWINPFFGVLAYVVGILRVLWLKKIYKF